MPTVHDGPDHPATTPLHDLFHSQGSPLDFSDQDSPDAPPGNLRSFRRQAPPPQVKGKVVSASASVLQGAARWERLGQSLLQTRSGDLGPLGDAPESPEWLGQRMGLSRLADTIPEADEGEDEEEHDFPLRYGIRLDPPDRPAGRGSTVAFPAGTTVSSLLHFPIGFLTAAPRDRVPAIQFADAVLPFRTRTRRMIAVFSLIGGTGRTSIAAGLARMLAGNGLRVLLADTCAHSVLPRLFGGGDVRQGVIRHFLPVSGDTHCRVSLVSVAVDAFAGDEGEQYRILNEVVRDSATMDRIIWDLSGAPLDWAAKVLCTSSQILIPLLPDTNSMVQLRATERFINRCHQEDPSTRLRFVLNHFDEKDPQHLEMRGQFRQRLGSRMVQATLRRSPLVDQALSHGRTVVDHAPASPLVSDLWMLARQLNQMEGDACGHPAARAPLEWLEQ